MAGKERELCCVPGIMAEGSGSCYERGTLWQETVGGGAKRSRLQAKKKHGKLRRK